MRVSLLHLAVVSGYPAIVKLLLHAGANPKADANVSYIVAIYILLIIIISTAYISRVYIVTMLSIIILSICKQNHI